jgi:hypothetical protein
MPVTQTSFSRRKRQQKKDNRDWSDIKDSIPKQCYQHMSRSLKYNSY